MSVSGRSGWNRLESVASVRSWNIILTNVSDLSVNSTQSVFRADSYSFELNMKDSLAIV